MKRVTQQLGTSIDNGDFSENIMMSGMELSSLTLALNIDEICFTDHVDYGIKADHDEKRKAGQMLNVDYWCNRQKIGVFLDGWSGYALIGHVRFCEGPCPVTARPTRLNKRNIYQHIYQT